MNGKKVILMLGFFMALFFFFGNAFCHDANQTVAAPFSGADPGSIKMWYDESWLASGFYRLERLNSNPGNPDYNKFRYEYTADPTQNTAPDSSVFICPAVMITRQDSDGTDYQDATGGGSIARDITVTEWEVSGHVHFQGGAAP